MAAGTPSRATTTKRVWLPSGGRRCRRRSRRGRRSTAAIIGAMRGHPDGLLLPHQPGRLGRGVGVAHLDVGPLAAGTAALPGGHRDGVHDLHVGQRRAPAAPAGTAGCRARPRAGSAGRASKASASMRQVDGALDGVLDGDEAELDVAGSTAASTSGMVRKGTSSPPARSGWVSSACSVKVPSGPRKPTRGGWVRSVGTGCQDSDVDDDALRALLDDVRQRRAAPRRGRGAAAAPPVRRPRLRPRRPPPRAAPGPARGGLRPRQDARAVRRHRRRAAARGSAARSCSPGPATSRPRPRWPPTRRAPQPARPSCGGPCPPPGRSRS